MNIEEEKIIDYIHDITNKGVACQSYLRLLQKKESLQGEEKELLDKAYFELMETFKIIKEFRKNFKK